MQKAVLALVISAIIGVVTVASGQSDGQTLTELEQAKVEILRLKIANATLQAQLDGCRGDLGALFREVGQLRADQASRTLTAEEAALKAAIERAHPGFVWDPKTGRFTSRPPEGGR